MWDLAQSPVSIALLEWFYNSGKPITQRADRVVAAAVKQVSDQVGRSVAQVALAWLRYRRVPVIPILGARKLSQLQDNPASFDLPLPPDQVKTLEHGSHIDLGFPQER